MTGMASGEQRARSVEMLVRERDDLEPGHL